MSMIPSLLSTMVRLTVSLAWLMSATAAASSSSSSSFSLDATRQLELVPNNPALADCYHLIQQSYGPDQWMNQDEYLTFLCSYSNGALCVTDWWSLDFDLSMTFYHAVPIAGEDTTQIDFRDSNPNALLAELNFLCPRINSYLAEAYPTEVPVYDFLTVITPEPTPQPTSEPTAQPTPEPTAQPTPEPTPVPTSSPVVAAQPAQEDPSSTPPPQQGLDVEEEEDTTLTTVTMTFSEASLGLEASQVPEESVIAEMMEAMKFMTENYYNNVNDRRRRRRLGGRRQLSSDSEQQQQEIRGTVQQVSTTLVYHSSRLFAAQNIVQLFYNQTLTFQVPEDFTLEAKQVAMDPFNTQAKMNALLGLSAFSGYPSLVWIFEGEDIPGTTTTTVMEPTPAPEEESQDQEPKGLDADGDDEEEEERSDDGKTYGPGALVVLVLLGIGLVAVSLVLIQRQYRKSINPIAASEKKGLSSKNKPSSTSRDEDNVTTVSYTNTHSEWGELMGQSASGLVVEEERMVEVVVPPGKLGLILSTTSTGAPVVRSVKETSVVDHLMAAGDKILKVDEVEVERMPVTKICTLLSKRAKNPERVITVVRAVSTIIGEEEGYDTTERLRDEEDPWVPVNDPLGRKSFYNRDSGVIALEHPRVKSMPQQEQEDHHLENANPVEKELENQIM